MNEFGRTFYESLVGGLETLTMYVRAALSSGCSHEEVTRTAKIQHDPDFQGWLHNDAMVTGNPASRYGDDAPGYLTGNGLGSLEIGAADD